jgi:hypothetical protein
MKPLPALLLASALALPAWPARAGALLTKVGQASVGPLVEGETTVALQLANGAVEYRKDTLQWYTTEAEVDSLLKAAQKARAAGNFPVALALYDLSAAQEPATQAQARSEIEAVRAQVANQAAATAITNAPAAPSLVTPEDKIAKGSRMIDGGSNVLAAPFLDAKNAAVAHDAAQKNIAEGSRLVAEGQKELAAQQAKAAAETAQRQETQAAATQAAAPSSWTQEEKLANGAVAVFLAILVFSSLHRIATREPKA